MLPANEFSRQRNTLNASHGLPNAYLSQGELDQYFADKQRQSVWSNYQRHLQFQTPLAVPSQSDRLKGTL